MGYLDYAGLQYLWGKLKEKFASKSHSHDDRYYTEAEMDGKLNSKVNNNEAGANGLFSKLTTSWTATPTDNTYFIRQDTGGGNEFGRVKFSTLWNYIKGKTDGVYQPKGSYAASGHTHDDRYYTETEINAKLDGKSNTGHTHDDRYYTESEIDSKLSGKANSNHSHYSITTVADNRNTNTTPNDYRNTFIFQGLKYNSKINSPSSDTYSYLLGLRGWSDSSGGNSHELAFNNTGVYWRNGSTEWNGWNRLYTENYHPNADHASSADYATNAGSANGVAPEWSGSVDLNSSSWLAAWSSDGKKIKAMSTGTFAKASHKHTKSQITDFPTSMPASDVSAWAKAATKPSYTKAEVGLSNVDNTADKDKNVKFATSAGSATNAQCLSNDSQYMRFHWNGQSGQPSWLWGGSDASNMYVYNPSNFSVNYANSAGTTLDAPYTITYEGTYTGTGEDTGSASLPIRHTLSKSYDLVYFIKNLKNMYIPSLIDRFSQGNYGKQYVAMNMLPTTFTAIINLSPNRITMYNGGSNNSTSGQAANKNYIRRNGNSIEFYSTYSSNNADYFFNDKYTSYYIFGFNLNHSLFHYDV